MHRIILFIFLIFSWACTSVQTDENIEEPKSEMAVSTIDSAISFYCATPIEENDISFDFRDRRYGVEWLAEGVHYFSTYNDSLGIHERHLQGGEYSELLDGAEITVSAKDAKARSASVNSVLYFALLPLHLRDKAVNVEELGTETIADKTYHKIEVSFAEEGGGDDFDDIFLYWFDTEDYSMDYLAYSYREDEGGTRFRVAKNSRRINGVMFQDYFNYQGPHDPDSLSHISNMFNAGELKLLSEINLEQIHVDKK